jgi:ribose transport system substrate-binding protein
MGRWGLLGFWIALGLVAGCSGGGGARAKYRVAVIPKGMSHEFWQSIKRGAERAAADLEAKGLRVQVQWDGPLTEDDTNAQVNILQKHTATGVSGIVLAPQHSKTMILPVEQAVQANIPVVIIDSGLDKPELYIKYVATDNYNGGRLAAQRLLKVLNDAGKPAPRLLLLRYAPGSESTEQREKGFLDHLESVIAQQKAANQPTIQLISSDKYAGPTAETAANVASPLLSRFGDQADGIFAPNESSATGVLNVLRSRDLQRKIKLVGFDSSEPLVKAVKEGDVDGLIVQDPYRMGYLGVWVLVQYLEGYDVAADGKNLSTGEYVLTRENADDPATRELFDPEAQKQRTIKVPEFSRKR